MRVLSCSFSGWIFYCKCYIETSSFFQIDHIASESRSRTVNRRYRTSFEILLNLANLKHKPNYGTFCQVSFGNSSVLLLCLFSNVSTNGQLNVTFVLNMFLYFFRNRLLKCHLKNHSLSKEAFKCFHQNSQKNGPNCSIRWSLRQFAKDSVRLVKRCTKPDKKGNISNFLYM